VPTRRPLTSGANDSEPVFAPDGESVVFIRQDGLHRVFLSDGRIQRLTSGFRLYRSPALLPSGWVVAAWTQDKVHASTAFDLAGSGRETLYEGSVHYGRLARRPTVAVARRHLSVYDLRFRPLDALLQRTERIRCSAFSAKPATAHPLAVPHNRNSRVGNRRAWGMIPTIPGRSDSAMAVCPECEADVEIDEYDVDKGEIISCPECGVELEVLGLSPVQFARVSLADGEDWP